MHPGAGKAGPHQSSDTNVHGGVCTECGNSSHVCHGRTRCGPSTPRYCSARHKLRQGGGEGSCGTAVWSGPRAGAGPPGRQQHHQLACTQQASGHRWKHLLPGPSSAASCPPHPQHHGQKMSPHLALHPPRLLTRLICLSAGPRVPARQSWCIGWETRRYPLNACGDEMPPTLCAEALAPSMWVSVWGGADRAGTSGVLGARVPRGVGGVG